MQMIERFLEYISIEKRYSEHTSTSYRKDLKDFLEFLVQTEAHEDLKKVDKKIVRNFIIHLSEKKLSKRSINRKISSLRSFYLFLLKISEIKISPLENISSLKFYAEKQIPFSKEEMLDFQQKTEALLENSSLEKLIIETLYQTGMRRAELCNLRFSDVDINKKEVRITGKGNKERIIPISPDLISDFQKYIQIRNPGEDYKDYFFINKKGKKLGEKFVYSVVTHYLGLASSKKKKSPHILRHSFATHTLDGGAEISKVKKILGHASLASTQVYTNADIEQLKKVFNKAHPRGNKNNDE